MLFQNRNTVEKSQTIVECGKCKVGKREPASATFKPADIVCVVDTLTPYRYGGHSAADYVHAFSDIQTIPTMACDLRYGQNKWKQNYCLVKAADKAIGSMCCKPRFVRAMEQVKPKVIIVMGSSASTAVIRPDYRDWNAGKYDEITYTWLKSAHWGAHVVCVPELEVFNDKRVPDAYYLRLEATIKKAYELAAGPRPKAPSEDHTVTTGMDTVDYIDSLTANKKAMVAFDYETNGIQPYSEGFFIRSCACYAGKGLPNAFLVKGDEFEFEIQAAWKQFLKSNTRKIAQNMKYEYQFAKMTLGVETKALVFDPMLAAHVLENRAAPKGLKWLAYQHLGIPEYNTVVDSYLKGEKGSNKNTIMECPVGPLLKYNALDSYYTYLIARIQMTLIKAKHAD